MKKGKLPALVQLAIATLLTTVIWVAFEVYRAVEREPEPSVSNEVLLQLDPTLDQVALDKLVNRITLEDAEIGDTVLTDIDGNIQAEVEVEVEDEPQETEEDELIIPEEESDPIESTQSGEN